VASKETTVRTATLKVCLAILGLGALAACGDARANAASDELKKDLELATSTTMTLATPKVDSSLLSLENKPAAAPAPATRVRRGAGTRAVASESPTVEATPDVDAAAVDETEEVESEELAPAPAPESAEPVAVAPRPQPVIIQTGGAGDYGVGTGGRGTGGPGVVIRGGGVDGDNCRIHTGRQGGGTGVVYRGPVYIPRTSTQPTGVRVGGGSSIGQRGPARESSSNARPASSGSTGTASRPGGRFGIR
jgi:hypothetical protein